jgi:nitrogen fixation/metabolism regulation signal transduction histidine kinase
MKTQSFHRLLSAVAAFMGLALFATNAVAQDYTTAAGSNTTQMTVSSQTAPALSYGVAAVLQMSQAKVSDTTIITYIQNSRSRYGLDASQIIYLRQEGVSDAVITAMLSQNSGTVVANATQAAPQPGSTDTSSTQTSTPLSQPTTTDVQAVPTSTVYVIPNTQAYDYSTYYYQPYYYPYYVGPCPAVSIALGFGGYHRGGYYYRGGVGFHGGGWHR